MNHRSTLPILYILALPCLAACATVPPPPSPEVAYAWATFDSRDITRSGASGLADRAEQRALTIDDPVRIASISKLVLALGVMRLVEEGKLELDRDVSDWLGWRLRHPDFPDQPITLRLLLSHRSSLTDQVDYAIPLGGSLKETLGRAGAFDRERRPGSGFRYSNLNFPVIASVMEKATGERFDRLMDQLVLDPLGIDACFNWTSCSETSIDRAVVLYRPGGAAIRDELGGRRPDCPVLTGPDGACDLRSYVPGDNGALFSPQGGLRISVSDLAVVGRLVLNGGWHEGRRFLTYRSLREMFSPQWRFDGPASGDTEGGFYCAYGLAVQLIPNDEEGCSDDLFGPGRQMAGHAGEAYGLRSGLWIDSANGIGIAYFSTGNGDDPAPGRTAYRAVEEWLAARLD